MTCNKALEPRMRFNQCEFSIQLPVEFLSLLDSFGLFYVVSESGFDAMMSMVAFKRTTEIDWTKLSIEHPFLCYDLNGGV